MSGILGCGAVLGPTVPLSLTLFSVSAPATPVSFHWSDGPDAASDIPVVDVIAPLPFSVIVDAVAIVVAAASIYADRRARRVTNSS